MADELFTSLDRLLANAKAIILEAEGKLSDLAIRTANTKTLAGRTPSTRQLASVTAEAIRESLDPTTVRLDGGVESGELVEVAGMAIIRSVLLSLLCQDEEITAFVENDHLGIIDATTGMISFPSQAQVPTPRLDALVERIAREHLLAVERGLDETIQTTATLAMPSISETDVLNILVDATDRFGYIADELPTTGPVFEQAWVGKKLLLGLVIWRLSIHPDILESST